VYDTYELTRKSMDSVDSVCESFRLQIISLHKCDFYFPVM